jgi:excisionase family DNA binding protein
MALEGGEMRSSEKTRVPLAISEGDQRQVLELYQKIQRSRAKLVGPDGKSQSLPVSLYEFLVRLIADLGEGQSVAIMQNDAQLTTVEAARMLGVSRQFLIKVLERDEIPHHMVGTHRRVYVRDLLAYKAKRDSKRRQILDDLTRAEAEDGLYDLVSPDDRAE